jgi:tRNA A-37 threonylcarbamoyl transferase component Bud32
MSQPHDTLGIGVSPGDVLAGKFRVERVLGRGGMGAVVAAHHVVLDQKVALKFLLPAALENPDTVARFVREAKAAARIRSEHVVRVIDVGQLDSGAPYIVMEYLDGTDLSAWVATQGPMPIELAVDFLLQACEAIADAHAMGIVHRDLKPANLFHTTGADGMPSIKVLDFGISKLITPGVAGDMTRTNAVVGTPYYMSPEQMAASRNADARSDIWSLGVILFELLTGRPPFTGESVSALAINVATAPHPPLRLMRADAPVGLERALATCLEKDRARRFQSIGDLAVALGEFGSPAARTSVDRILGVLRQAGMAGGREPSASSAPSASAGFAGPDPLAGGKWTGPSTASSWGQTGTKGSSRAAFAGVAAALAVIVLVAGGIIVARTLGARSAATSGPAPSSSAGAPPVGSSAGAPPDAPASTPLPASSLAGAAPAAPSSAPASPSASPEPRPPPPAHHGGAPPAGSVPGPAPTSAPASNCHPPYYFDSEGHKQYKPECM